MPFDLLTSRKWSARRRERQIAVDEDVAIFMLGACNVVNWVRAFYPRFLGTVGNTRLILFGYGGESHRLSEQICSIVKAYENCDWIWENQH